MRFVVVALRFLLGAVAIAIVATSFAMNGLFWLTLYAANPQAKWVALIFSVACGCAKVGIPALLAAQCIRWRDAHGLVLVWCLAFSFDVWSGLGYNSQTQGDVSAESQQHEAVRAKAQADADRLDGKLKQIPKDTRAVGPLRAEIARAAAEAGRCVARTADTDACQRLFKLQTELANADERGRLEAEAAPLRQQLATAQPERDALAHLAAGAKGLRTVGLTVAPETLGYAWTALMLLLIELCPSAVLAHVFRPAPPAPIQLERPRQRAVAVPSASPAVLAQARPAGDVLQLMRAAAPGVDGWIGPFTQRHLGLQLGVSGAEVNRQIRELADARVVDKRTGRGGTYLKFVRPAQSLALVRSTA